MRIDDQFSDIQGIVMRAYGYMPAANYFLCRIEDHAQTKQWLCDVFPTITHANGKPNDKCLNIAFTRSGLEQLQLPKETIEMFSHQYIDGMTVEHSERRLGDDTSKWEWGNASEKDTLHMLVMLFAPDEAKLADETNSIQSSFMTHHIKILHTLGTSAETLMARKEHFGFKDGISQPIINEINRKTGKPEPFENQIKPGEILLGYKNEYDIYPYTPTVKKEQDPHGYLPFKPDSKEEKDFGKNGSYLIFRQLSQDVKAFWKYMEENADADDKEKSRDMIAAKMMGRWRSGTPLSKCPMHDDPALSDDNTFGFHEDDQYGYKCPAGAHIRRSNPRDIFLTPHKYPSDERKKPEDDKERSIKFIKKHRIVRRGRPYGDPVAASFEPKDILATPDNGKKRGLHFICLNANIARQFELIQQTWVNGKFAGLYDDPDPIIGGAQAKGKNFTIQKDPLRKRYTDLPQFIDTKGGAYFFLPGISALKYLAHLV